MVGERVRFLFTSCEESQTKERVCDSSQQVNKNRTSVLTMNEFVYYICTEIFEFGGAGCDGMAL